MAKNESGQTPSVRDGPPDVYIVFIDRKPLTRGCLAECLNSVDATSRITALADPDAALQDSATDPPDLIILNVGSSSADDADVQRDVERVKRRFAQAPLVILSDHEELERIHAAIRLGAQGYLTTSLEPSVAAAAVRLVIAGGTFIPISRSVDGVAQIGLTGTAEHGDPEIVALTPREMQILDQIRLGKSNKLIAYELNLRESTLKCHIRRIKHKVRAHTRVELAMRAAELL